MAFRSVALRAIATLAVVSSNAPAVTYRFSSEPRATVESRALGRAEGHYQLDLNVPVLAVEDAEDGFQRLVAPGLVPTVKVGQPELGTTGALFAVPPGYTLRWRLTGVDTKAIDGVLPRPAQREMRCGQRTRNFSFDRAAYQGVEFAPRSPVTLERVGSLRGIDLVRVAFTPLRANPSERKVEVTTRATVDVWLEQVERSAPAPLSPSFATLVRQATVNGADVVRGSARQEEAMLIIVADGIRDALNPLVEWKRQTGLKVDVVSVSTIGSDKTKIGAFLKKYWSQATTKPTFLLLAGDKTSVPPNFESTSSGSAASDWRYSLQEGGDDDKVPDLFYGRLLADSKDEASRLVARWIAYERDVLPSDHYVKGAMVASDEGENPSDAEYTQQIADVLKAGNFTAVDRFLQGEKTATASNITKAVNEGRSWMTYIGHGSGTEWGSTNDTFDVAAVNKLANGAKLPVLVDVACMNGAWTRIAKCFGRAWSNGANGGAIGYYGGSVNISWHPPAVMAVGVAKAHFEKGVTTLGGSTIGGQLYLLEKMGTNDDTVENMQWYNLFGDPSLVLRTTRPLIVHATPSVARLGGNGALLAVATELEDGRAAPGLNVVVTDRAGAVVARSTTDAGGTAYLRLAQRTQGLVVTVSGANVAPTQWHMR